MDEVANYSGRAGSVHDSYDDCALHTNLICCRLDEEVDELVPFSRPSIDARLVPFLINVVDLGAVCGFPTSCRGSLYLRVFVFASDFGLSLTDCFLLRVCPTGASTLVSAVFPGCFPS